MNVRHNVLPPCGACNAPADFFEPKTGTLLCQSCREDLRAFEMSFYPENVEPWFRGQMWLRIVKRVHVAAGESEAPPWPAPTTLPAGPHTPVSSRVDGLNTGGAMG